MQRYDVHQFGGMIGPANARRVDAYTEALRRAITPGCTVLDIGTGVGYFAVVAAQLGAGHVYGVDPNPAVELAPAVAEANGVADRTTFRRGISTDIDLPQRADVIVSDIRGSLPWLQTHLPSIIDARARHLAPGGVLIPARDVVWATVVHAPTTYETLVAPWENEVVDLGPIRRRACDHLRKMRVHPERLIVPPQRVATLDYTTIIDPDVATELRWTVADPQVGHGLALWFETELVDGVGFSNAPTEPSIPMYGQTLFPWREPVDLAVGDEITVHLRGRLVGNDYGWEWATRVRSDDGAVRVSFDQARLPRPMPVVR